MLRPLVLLWLAAPTALPEVRPDISRWAAARGFGPVSEPHGAVHVPYDDAAASQIEALLEEARTAPSATAGVFEHLERLLTMHPHLPQAAWLSAERFALQARAAAQGAGVAGSLRATELEERSVLLEGPRASPYGQHGRASEGRLPSPPAATLQVEGLRPQDQLFIDGLPVARHAFAEPGPHHIQVFRGRARVRASWIELGSPPRLSVEDTTRPCSELDLAGVTEGSGGPLTAPGILCGDWVAARLNLVGAVEVASCRASECSPWAPPFVGVERGLTPTAASRSGDELPSWVTWSAVGVGAAAALGLVLWRSGAFQPSEAATEFVFTGPTAAALRF